MIVDFFRHGTGLSKGCLDYLLGEQRDRQQAEILSGDLELTAQLIDSSPYTKKYTSGCLSFYEQDLPTQDKSQIMRDFERCLFPNMEPDQYQILWVQHQDKDRLELNFVIPNVELTTGKRLQPFYAPVDLERVDLFKRITNKNYKLYDPDDPDHQQVLVSKKNLPRDVKEFKEKLHEYVCKYIENGEITDRTSLIMWLESNDVKVTRQTPRFISIENPCENAKRPIRLNGEIYEQGFRADRQYRQQIQNRITEYRGTTEQRHRENLSHYQRQLERKSQYHQERYPRSRQTSLTSDSRQYTADQQQGRSISNLDRIVIEHRRPKNTEKTINNKPDTFGGCSYSNYWSFCTDMGLQKQVSRNTSLRQSVGRETASYQPSEQCRSEDQILNLWSEPKTLFDGQQKIRNVRGECRLYDTDGILKDDRTRNATLKHYRTATESITDRFNSLRSSSEYNQTVGILWEATTRIQQQNSGEEQQISQSNSESQFFRELTNQIQGELGESFRKIGERTESQRPHYGLSTENGTRRNQGTDHAFSFGVLRREREHQGLSQSVKRLDTDILSKIINGVKQCEEKIYRFERSNSYSM